MILVAYGNVLVPCSGCSIIGYDRQNVYRAVAVDKVYISLKSVLHTLFHILGRYHEHQRQDKDSHIRIIKENVIEGVLVVFRSMYCKYMCFIGVQYMYILKLTLELLNQCVHTFFQD